MKYLVLLCDGMADEPFEKLNGKTPMELAHKPNMDALAKNAIVGISKNVPDGMKPGSDVANLAVMGYYPADYYTGRSPLEAANIGVALKDSEYAIRCNLVTLSDEPVYAEKKMVDYCGGDISTEEADELVKALAEILPDSMKLYTGVSYRHCLTWENLQDDIGYLSQPHDIPGRVVGEYLPGEGFEELRAVMEKSYDFLMAHPVNKKRVSEGKRPANSMWLWGQGRSAKLDNFYEKNGLKGAVISAVDLLQGIGLLAGMDVIKVEGATGYMDTNFKGKADAAIKAFETNDYVYLHLEAPDECGHRGEAENKIKSIEIIDEVVLAPVKAALDASGEDYRIMVLPDHPTPLTVQTHTSTPVPFLIYDNRETHEGVDCFTEEAARATGIYQPVGSDLLLKCFKK